MRQIKLYSMLNEIKDIFCFQKLAINKDSLKKSDERQCQEWIWRGNIGKEFKDQKKIISQNYSEEKPKKERNKTVIRKNE